MVSVALCGASEPVLASLAVLGPGLCVGCEESCSQLLSTSAVKQRWVARGCSREARSVLLRVVVFACKDVDTSSGSEKQDRRECQLWNTPRCVLANTHQSTSTEMHPHSSDCVHPARECLINLECRWSRVE